MFLLVHTRPNAQGAARSHVDHTVIDRIRAHSPIRADTVVTASYHQEDGVAGFFSNANQGPAELRQVEALGRSGPNPEGRRPKKIASTTPFRPDGSRVDGVAVIVDRCSAVGASDG